MIQHVPKRSTIYQGHVIDVLRTWEDKSVDCIITSPPYWSQRWYGAFEMIWGGNKDCNHEWTEIVLGKARGQIVGSPDSKGWDRPSRHARADNEEQTSYFCKKCKAWRGNLGLEPSFRLFIRNLRDVFREARRVLTDDGAIYTVIGETFYGTGTQQKNTGKLSYMPSDVIGAQTRRGKGSSRGELPRKCMVGIPERFMLMMIDDLGFVLRSKIIWWKKNAIPEPHTDRFTVDFEPVYMFTKKPRYWHDLQFERCAESSLAIKEWKAVGGKKYAHGAKFSGKNATKAYWRTMRSVWDIPVVTNRKEGTTKHYAPFPPRLVERMIRASVPRDVCSKCGAAIRIKHPKRERLQKEYPEGVPFTSCFCEAPYRKGVVADIFLGSGTTALVAKWLGLDWVGIEVNPAFVTSARARINSNKPELERWMLKQNEISVREIQVFVETSQVETN